MSPSNSTSQIEQVSRILTKQIPESKLLRLLFNGDYNIKNGVLKVLMNRIDLSSDTINVLLSLTFDTKYAKSNLAYSAVQILKDQYELNDEIKERLVKYVTDQSLLTKLIIEQIEECRDLESLRIYAKLASRILSCQIKPKDNELITKLMDCANHNKANIFIKGQVLHALKGIEHNEELDLLRIRLLFDVSIRDDTRHDIIYSLDQLEELSDSNNAKLQEQLLTCDDNVLSKILSTYFDAFIMQIWFSEWHKLLPPNFTSLDRNGTVTKIILRHLLQRMTRGEFVIIESLGEQRDRRLVRFLQQYTGEILGNEENLETKMINFIRSTLSEEQDWISLNIRSLSKSVCNDRLSMTKRREAASNLAVRSWGLPSDMIKQILSCCCGSLETIELIMIIFKNRQNFKHMTVNELINILALNSYKDISKDFSLEELHEKLIGIYNNKIGNAEVSVAGAKLLLKINFTRTDILKFLRLLDFKYVDSIVFNNVLEILKYQKFDTCLFDSYKLTTKCMEILYRYIFVQMCFISQRNISSDENVIIESGNESFNQLCKLEERNYSRNLVPNLSRDYLSIVFMFKSIDEIRKELKSIKYDESNTSFRSNAGIAAKNPVLQIAKIQILKEYNTNLKDIILNALKSANNELKLRHLNLSNNSLSSKHMGQLCTALESPLASQLKSLILSYNYSTYADLKYLLKFLAEENSPKIEFLFIDHNLIYTTKSQFKDLVHGFSMFGGILKSEPLFHSNFELIDISMNYLKPGKESSKGTSNARKYYVVDHIANSSCIHSECKEAMKSLNGDSDVRYINTLLSEERGAVSLFVRRRVFGFSGHTCLIIERIHPNFPSQRQLIKTDLVYVNDKVKLRIFYNLSPEELIELRQNSWVRNAWANNTNIEALLNDIYNDIPTTDFHSYSMLNIFKRQERHNCYSYLVPKLKKHISIETDWTYRTEPFTKYQIIIILTLLFAFLFYIFLKF